MNKWGDLHPVSPFGLGAIKSHTLGIHWRTRWGGWPAQFLSLSAGAAAAFGILSFAHQKYREAWDLFRGSGGMDLRARPMIRQK